MMYLPDTSTQRKKNTQNLNFCLLQDIFVDFDLSLQRRPTLMRKKNREEIMKFRNILFDNKLSRAQFLISNSKPSKKFLLRILTLMEKNDVYAGYDDWFLTEPKVPLKGNK
jgi:hypothetical protein